MRISIRPETIRVYTVVITDPETGEPTGVTKEVLNVTIAFGMEKVGFTFDMPPDKPKIVAEIKTAATKILANRQKAENVKNWLETHNLLDVDTDEL